MHVFLVLLSFLIVVVLFWARWDPLPIFPIWVSFVCWFFQSLIFRGDLYLSPKNSYLTYFSISINLTRKLAKTSLDIKISKFEINKKLKAARCHGTDMFWHDVTFFAARTWPAYMWAGWDAFDCLGCFRLLTEKKFDSPPYNRIMEEFIRLRYNMQYNCFLGDINCPIDWQKLETS
jgi:hypothetical protein